MAANKPRRSPGRAALRACLLTVGSIAVVGLVVSMIVLPTGGAHYQAGQAVGRVAGIAGLVAAGIAYVVQKKRLDRIQRDEAPR